MPAKGSAGEPSSEPRDGHTSRLDGLSVVLLGGDISGPALVGLLARTGVATTLVEWADDERSSGSVHVRGPSWTGERQDLSNTGRSERPSGTRPAVANEHRHRDRGLDHSATPCTTTDQLGPSGTIRPVSPLGHGLGKWAGGSHGVDNVADCLPGCGGVGFVVEERFVGGVGVTVETVVGDGRGPAQPGGNDEAAQRARPARC